MAVVAGLAVGCSGSSPRQAGNPASSTVTAAASTAVASTVVASTVTPTIPTPTTPTTVRATTTTTAGAAASAATVSAADLGASWRPGCPLGPDQLRLLHLGYWGFDGQPHAGTMVVNAAVTADVIKIFSILYREHFPIHLMQPVDVYGGSDPASMAADNTSGFNCRNAVAAGPPHWSVHAFGEAIDVNTVENPYIQGSVVTPPAGAAFVDRSMVRPGMAVEGGQLVQAFAAAGWAWGGRWATPDYQHFSKTGG